jgi:hypothetical protein
MTQASNQGTPTGVVIETLSTSHRSYCDQVAALHLRYLADSPVVQFGDAFLKRFYYGKLLAAGLIGATIARSGDRVVGFISYTRQPNDFMTIGLRRWFVYLSALLSLSVLRRPAMVRDIWQTLRMMRERGMSARDTDPRTGEVLSLVVAEDARDVIPVGGRTRVTVRLFQEMVAYFRAAGFQRAVLLVKPQNFASNLFCSSMGCEFDKITTLGAVTHRYTYHIPQETEVARQELTAAR